MWAIFKSKDRERMRKKIIICDIDNTLADSLVHAKMIGEDLDNWNDSQVKEFLKSCKSYNTIPGSEKLNKLVKRLSADVYFITARSEQGRRETREWLSENNFFKFLDKTSVIKDTRLFMRANEDFRPGYIIKLDIFCNVLKKRLNANFNYDFIFIDDDIKCLDVYNVFGLTLKAPECWKCL